MVRASTLELFYKTEKLIKEGMTLAEACKKAERSVSWYAQLRKTISDEKKAGRLPKIIDVASAAQAMPVERKIAMFIGSPRELAEIARWLR